MLSRCRGHCYSAAAQIPLILEKAAILKLHCPLSSQTLAEPEAEDSGDSSESVSSREAVASTPRVGTLGVLTEPFLWHDLDGDARPSPPASARALSKPGSLASSRTQSAPGMLPANSLGISVDRSQALVLATQVPDWQRDAGFPRGYPMAWTSWTGDNDETQLRVSSVTKAELTRQGHILHPPLLSLQVQAMVDDRGAAVDGGGGGCPILPPSPQARAPGPQAAAPSRSGFRILM